MPQGRIPVKLNEFVDHLGSVTRYLSSPVGSITRGETLGMLPDEVAKLIVFKNKCFNNDLANPGIFNLHFNSVKKNKTTRLNALSFIREFSVFFRPLLIRMSVSPNITSADRMVLRIAEPDTTRSRRTVPIAEECFAQYYPKAGGDVKLVFRTRHDSNRPSKPQGADAVEVAWRIDEPLKAPDALGNTKYTPIANPDDGTTRTIYTKASFMARLGAENSGNYFQFYARWINTRHPLLAGSWSQSYVMVIC